MKGLREADLKKAAALAELKPPLDATDRQTLPLKILPAGFTEQPVSPAATKGKCKKGKALEGGSKAAGKRKHGGAAAAAAEPEPEAAQARGPEEGQASPEAGSKAAAKYKRRKAFAAAAAEPEPEAAQALGPEEGQAALEGGSKAATKRKRGKAATAAAEPEPEAAQVLGPEEGQAAPKGGSKAATKRKRGKAAAAEPEPEAAQALGPEEGQAAPKGGSKAATKRDRGKAAAAAAEPEPEAAQALGPALAILKAARKSTGSRALQAVRLQRVQEELLAVRQSLKPLQERQQKELLKHKSKKATLKELKEAIAPLSTSEQQLLDERKVLETQPEGLETAEEWTNFAAAIPQFLEQPDDDGFLHFPVSIPCLGGGRDLFVREVYVALWDHVTNSSLKGFVVSGNAGIGKSWWLVWALVKLLKDGKEVLWHVETQGEKDYFFFDGKGEVKAVNYNTASKLLQEGGLCYLVDGAVPHASAMYRFDLSLVAHSYKPDRFKNYQKQLMTVSSEALIMDPWTPTEILKVAAKLHTQLDDSLVKERLDVLGGIPRQVFADSNNDSLADAEKALKNLELEKFVSGFTPDAVGFPDTASHRLLLISAPAWRSGDFKTCEVDFRSYNIRRRVYQQIKRMGEDQQRAFLAASDDKAFSGVRTLKGLMMEFQMHNTLARGGKFKVRELLPRKAGRGRPVNASPGAAANEVTDLHLPPLKRKRFRSVMQLPSIADAYAVPKHPNFPGIDALHPSSGRMFQCTVSTKHDLKAGIFDTLEQLDSSIDPAVYVVVPDEETFNEWTKGMKFPTLLSSASAKVQQHCNKLKQYVLLLESMKLDVTTT